MNGNFENMEEIMVPYLDAAAKDIVKQRKRLGGDWSIAFAVFSRGQRKFLRKLLGKDLVFIVLNMTKECQKKRLESRHGDGEGNKEFSEMLNKMYELYEPAGDDEENAFNLTITENMNRDDVIKEVLDILQKL